MDPTTVSILTSIASNYFTQFTAPTVQKFFEQAFRWKPSLESDLQNATTTRDIERIFHEAVGVIDAMAGDGSISVDRSLLTAVRGIRFNHQNGSVLIQGSSVQAPVLQTGGAGVGQTKITGSTLTSRGTAIQIGQGAAIVISGNASIIQN